MSRFLDLTRIRGRLRMPGGMNLQSLGRDPRVLVRAVLGFLLAANVVAALLVFRPWGASEQDLEQQISSLHQKVQQQKVSIERLRVITAKVERGRQEGDQFMTANFLDARTTYSTIVSELVDAAQKAGIKPKEHSFSLEPIEGSDTLSLMTITGNYEGNYADILHFVNLLDRSPRFVIIDSLQAAPMQSGAMLSVSFKLNAFVRQQQAVQQ